MDWVIRQDSCSGAALEYFTFDRAAPFSVVSAISVDELCKAVEAVKQQFAIENFQLTVRYEVITARNGGWTRHIASNASARRKRYERRYSRVRTERGEIRQVRPEPFDEGWVLRKKS